MAINNRKIGTKAAPYTRTDKSGLYTNPGPFIGIIKNNIDTTCNGRLQVYIPQLGAANENDPSSWITVAYASPFRGKTKRTSDLNQYVDPTIDFTSIDENSFQSYGFWFVPPTLNDKVLVTFANGDISQGYWFACINDAINSHMTPAIGAVTASSKQNDGGYIWQPTGSNAIPSHSMLQNYIEIKKDGQTEIPYRLPVSEPVLSAQLNSNPTAPSQIQMVPHVFQTKQLGIQGLAFDYIRGSTSASSIRENPSQVFGISTPGRLTSFSNVSTSAQIISEIQNLQDNNIPPDVAKALTNTYRTGGHQFVMDDGTIDGYDQGIRIRTTAGNEILMDDTNGQIYIINSSGTGWIELSPSGYIDIYSNNDFSVRSQGNLNFHADSDINMHADGDIKMHSGGSLNLESVGSMVGRSSENLTMFGISSVQVGSSGPLNLDSKGAMSVQSAGTLTEQGTQVLINSGGGVSVKDPGKIKQTNQIIVKQQSGSEVWWQDGTFQTIVGRAPAHEPWPDHEINGIRTFNVSSGTADPIPITRAASSGTSSGVRGTSKSNAITESDIAKQPAFGAACLLTIKQTQALMAQLGKQESSNNYAKQNSIGYSGKYQFGVGVLQDLGYIYNPPVKGDDTFTIINNSANWKGQNGCHSVQDWYTHTELQELEMVHLLNNNCRYLQKIGFINKDTPHTDVAGYLAVAHLLGPGGASNYYKLLHNLPQNSKYRNHDANGTDGSSYFALGSNAVKLVTG